MSAALNTDHVNYLVWRYLQEQGYGKAAVQLSRDWHNNDPQSLAFANNVKSHSLIGMLQDALAYDQLAADAQRTQDRSIEQSRDTERSNALEHMGRRWGFVDVTQRKTLDKPPTESRRESTSDNGEAKRKKQRRDTIDGSRPNAGRRKPSKPAEQAIEAEDDAMDVDDEGPVQQDEAMQEPIEQVPVKEEPPPPPPIPHTLEIGQSVGMQSEPVIDRTIAKTIASTSISGAAIYTVEWTSSSRLIVTGGSVCHKLNLTRNNLERDLELLSDADKHTESHLLSVEPALTEMDTTTKYAIGQWERSSGRQSVAAAIEQIQQNGDMTGTLSILQDGREIYLADTPNVVLALKWDAHSTKLLAIWDSTAGDQSFINTWDTGKTIPNGTTTSRRKVCDATWLTESSFACCGENFLDIYHLESDIIKQVKSIETDRPWEQLKFDPLSNMIVCTSSNDGEMGLFDHKEHVLHTKNAHDDTITNVEWQPQQEDGKPLDDSDQRMLATSCTDGSIKLWNARRALECIHVFAAGPMMPAWTSKFTRDGSKLAAVIGDEVRVWEAKLDGQLLAKWSRPKSDPIASEHGDDGEQVNSEAGAQHDSGDGEDAEDIPPMFQLDWDDQASRLAITRGSNIWIVQMPGTNEAESVNQQIHGREGHEMT